MSLAQALAMLLRLVVLLAFALLSGCGALAGAALGQVLCSSGDQACRNALFEGGLAADARAATGGGQRYASATRWHCHATDGRSLVILADEANVGLVCMQQTSSVCFCSGVGR